MSLNVITPPLGQTGPLAEIAKKEASNNKLLVVGIALLVISLIGVLVGLGLVISGLTCGSSFIIAGASLIGTSVLGIGIAALLMSLAKHRSQQLLKETVSKIEQEKPLEDKELVISPKEESLRNQLVALKTRLQEMDRIRDEEKENWRTEFFELSDQIKQLNITLENLVCERTKQSSENVRLISDITYLQQKNQDLKRGSQALATENEKLKTESERLNKENEANNKFLNSFSKKHAGPSFSGVGSDASPLWLPRFKPISSKSPFEWIVNNI